MAGTQLNKNNFLQWTGAFAAAPVVNIANNDAVSMVVNIASLIIDILANDVSGSGIDPASIVITVQDNITTPATWNSSTQRLTYYPPAGVGPGVRQVKYTFSDIYGNVSNEATINITMVARPTGWRVDPFSFSCEIVDGVKTGYGIYSLLEQYYTDDDSAVVPETTKDNVDSDPDFIPKAIASTCNPIIYLVRSLQYSAGDRTAPCASEVSTNYYVSNENPTWSIGMLLYTDDTLDTGAPTGWYSDHTYLLQVLAGRIINIFNCGS